jgi:hypothetical protein
LCTRISTSLYTGTPPWGLARLLCNEFCDGVAQWQQIELGACLGSPIVKQSNAMALHCATKLESTVRYLGIEVDDALEMAEQTEVQIVSRQRPSPRALTGHLQTLTAQARLRVQLDTDCGLPQPSSARDCLFPRRVFESWPIRNQ